MMFGNAIWLWGLTGLLIPIGIHLLSRKEGKVIRFGSLRHLQETPTQQFKHIQLNDLLQLVLRCLVIIVLVLLLADLRITSYANKKWILIEPTASLPATQSWVDSLKDADVEIRAFRHGFPLFNQQSEVPDTISYWKLIQDLNSHSLEKAFIISKAHFNQFTGERIDVPRFVTWIPLEQPEITFIQSIKKTYTDSVLITAGKSNPQITTFHSYLENVQSQRNLFHDSIHIQTQDTLTIALYADESCTHTANIIEAALYTLAKKANVFLVLSKNEFPKQSSSNHWLIWLSDKPPLSYGENRLLLREQLDKNLITQASTHEWYLTRPITEDDILSNHFLVQLSQVLLRPDFKAPLHDVRTMPEPLLWGSESISQIKPSEGNNPLEKILVFLMLAFVAIERLTAYKRNV